MINKKNIPLILVGIVFTLVVLIAITSHPTYLVSADADAVSISLGETVVSEGNDFATRVLGMPWDMQSQPYPDYPTVFRWFVRNSFSISNGMWHIDTQQRTPYDPSIWMLSPGIYNTQKVLKIGDKYPISTNTYRLLSFKLCINKEDSLNVLWYSSQLIPENTVFSASRFIDLQPGCHVYTVDLETVPVLNGKRWHDVDVQRGLRIDPGTQANQAHIDLDWVRLTSMDTGNIVPINWQNISTGSELNFYVNKTCSMDGATLIGSEPRNDKSSGTFNWGQSIIIPEGGDTWRPLPLPESFEPGYYSILMLVDDQGEPVCSSQALEIRKAPLLTFQKPSMYSGEDYAGAALNDQWGMTNPADVEKFVNITNQTWVNGILSAVNVNSDPNMHMNIKPGLNAEKYHYVTFRMKLNKLTDSFVSVQRFIWWYTQPDVDSVTTEDMLIREGWQTYSFDLNTAIIDQVSHNPKEWTLYPKVFRFDVHELGDQVPFEIDFISLTADEVVKQGVSFPIYYEVDSSKSTEITFYYDEDKNPSNGRDLIGSNQSLLSIPMVAEYDYKVTLPMIWGPNIQREIDLLTGDKFTWDTSTVPPGTYYISAVVHDGVVATTWYSEVPVTVISGD